MEEHCKRRVVRRKRETIRISTHIYEHKKEERGVSERERGESANSDEGGRESKREDEGEREEDHMKILVLIIENSKQRRRFERDRRVREKERQRG